jgi:uncharacterized membrane protein YgaE (UPF0421/DUF939 family)
MYFNPSLKAKVLFCFPFFFPAFIFVYTFFYVTFAVFVELTDGILPLLPAMLSGSANLTLLIKSGFSKGR